MAGQEALQFHSKIRIRGLGNYFGLKKTGPSNRVHSARLFYRYRQKRRREDGGQKKRSNK